LPAYKIYDPLLSDFFSGVYRK